MHDCDRAVCPICEGTMIGLHCKLICVNCGYREDCSDLFLVETRAHDADAAPAGRLISPCSAGGEV